MLGGGGGRIKAGETHYLGKSDRQMCRLFLSMMDKMDVHPKTFGDATVFGRSLTLGQAVTTR